MRIVAWNIMAGGGRRSGALAARLRDWRPDVVALCEFRATLPSVTLAVALAAHGLRHQATTIDPRRPNANAILVASRWPVEQIRLPHEPREPGRWLCASVAAPRPFTLGAMHVPNRVTGRKWPFMDAVLRVARRWPGGPALFLGDTNSGRQGLDEEVPAFNLREHGWIDGLEGLGWRDAFRHLRGEERAYTWYSPNGRNGFRLDQAFINDGLLAGLGRAHHAWGWHRGRGPIGLSDHAALLLDFRAD